MWDSLPLDLWASVPLGQRDLARLACTSREFRRITAVLAAAKRLRLASRHAGTLAYPRWQQLRDLMLCGHASRYGYAPDLMPRIAPLCLRALESLTLRHVRLQPRFWPAVFEHCLALRHVAVVGDFYMKDYDEDVRHAIDLVVHGAPRLTKLEIEGTWLVLYPTPTNSDLRARTLPAVQSDTLREYRAGCRQAPMGVDAPLDVLVVEETATFPFLVSRMGPRTLQHTRKLVWRCSWPAFDARLLRGYVGLRVADLTLSSVALPCRMAKCLRTLSGLPAGLRELSLHLDVWMMRTYEHDIEFGRPLEHLTGLESLRIEMLFPVESTCQLLAEWMGIGDSVRSVVLDFEEPGARGYEEEIVRLMEEDEAASDDETVLDLRARWSDAMQPLDPQPLLAWLQSHPACHVTIRNLPTLRCRHARLSLV